MVGTAHVEVLAQHLVEEDPPLRWSVEHLGPSELRLQNRDVVGDAPLPVAGRERMRQPRRPLAQQASTRCAVSPSASRLALAAARAENDPRQVHHNRRWHLHRARRLQPASVAQVRLRGGDARHPRQHRQHQEQHAPRNASFLQLAAGRSSVLAASNPCGRVPAAGAAPWRAPERRRAQQSRHPTPGTAGRSSRRVRRGYGGRRPVVRRPRETLGPGARTPKAGARRRA